MMMVMMVLVVLLLMMMLGLQPPSSTSAAGGPSPLSSPPPPDSSRPRPQRTKFKQTVLHGLCERLHVANFGAEGAPLQLTLRPGPRGGAPRGAPLPLAGVGGGERPR